MRRTITPACTELAASRPSPDHQRKYTWIVEVLPRSGINDTSNSHVPRQGENVESVMRNAAASVAAHDWPEVKLAHLLSLGSSLRMRSRIQPLVTVPSDSPFVCFRRFRGAVRA
jgi:hypothetical protein